MMETLHFIHGIFIKEMELPKYGCDSCFLRTGNYCGRLEKDESVVEYARKNKRHPNCPLIVAQILDPHYYGEES